MSSVQQGLIRSGVQLENIPYQSSLSKTYIPVKLAAFIGGGEGISPKNPPKKSEVLVRGNNLTPKDSKLGLVPGNCTLIRIAIKAQFLKYYP